MQINCTQFKFHHHIFARVEKIIHKNEQQINAKCMRRSAHQQFVNSAACGDEKKKTTTATATSTAQLPPIF